MSRAPGGRRRAAPRASVIGAGAGVLTVAALVAALQTGLPATAGASGLSADSRSIGSQDAASPTPGPLQIPTIGVVAPGFDDPYLSIAVSLPPTTSFPTALVPELTPVEIPSVLLPVDLGPAPDPGLVLADPPVQDPVVPPADPGTSPAQAPDDGTTTPTGPATETPSPSENPPVAETPPPTEVPPPTETPTDPSCPADPTDGTTDPTTTDGTTDPTTTDGTTDPATEPTDPTTACPPDPCAPPDDPATGPTDPTTTPAVPDPTVTDPAATDPAAPTCEPAEETPTPTP